LALFITTVGPLVAQRPSTSPERLPPLSYVCPMPADAAVLEDKPGRCPKCGMTLQPIRLDLRYTCPAHPTYIQEKPGKHAIDGRDLVPVTLSVSWTCSDQKFLEPGTCPDGKTRTIRYETRPHGDHNPKHGGQFFMAPDAWHHLEGTYPRDGLFRMYFYDDYSKPLAPTAFGGSLSVLNANDQEVAANLPLKRSRIANAMEVTVPSEYRAFPIRLLARVRFGTGSDNAFNFQFAARTKDEPPPAPPVTTRNQSPATTPRSVPQRSPAASASGSPPANAQPLKPSASSPSMAALAALPAPLQEALDESSLPRSVPGLLDELGRRAGEITRLVENGDLGAVWVPAMGTKTVALALEPFANELAEPARQQAAMAIKRIVTAAWDLDAFGDLGNKPKLDAANKRLAEAVSTLRVTYESRH